VLQLAFAYINGIYFYILACHKGANHGLMNRYEDKQVLYLRGFDIEESVASGGSQAVGFSSVDAAQFNWTLGRLLASRDFRVFKVLSPKDVYWETVEAQRYFYSEFADMIPLARQPMRSIFLNALRWKEGVADLLDRMDHFVVYVPSISESALWELQQLDTDDRRGRVTVVFDQDAIEKKEMHLGLQQKLQNDLGDKLIWRKEGPAPDLTAAELRERLSREFLLTTPEAFEKEIEEHRRRIAADSARLPPGARETWLDCEFYPALDTDKLKALREFAARIQALVAAGTGEKGITCLPLFLNHVQMRIFMTLLMGEHHETGLALAAYAAVMQGALDYFGRPGKKAGDLSEEGRERHLAMLQDHFEMARHIGLRMLSFGKSHEFGDYSAIAAAEFEATVDRTMGAVGKFLETVRSRPPVL